ncbi:hypothetical protein CCACVL1_03633, partial [Corchorus capsularis]
LHQLLLRTLPVLSHTEAELESISQLL